MNFGPIPAMSAQQLFELCQPVYGDRWIPRLSDDLAVNLRTVQRWASGETTITEKIARQIRNAIETRRARKSQ